jgi:tetratricopeptide (TPR) repeat protein
MTDQTHDEVEGLLKEGIIQKESKHFPEAAAIFTDAIIRSIDNGYDHGVVHGLMNMGTIWKLKARESENKSYSELAQLAFRQAQTYATEHSMDPEEVIHTSYLLGQAELELGNYDVAVKLYKECFDFYTQHPRNQAHLGDVQRHLGTAMVMAGGREDGIKIMEEGLQKIRSFDEPEDFDKRNFVWETGALLGLAYAYKDLDQDKARQYANEALEIATREALVIRKEEALKLLEKINSSK